MRHVLRQPALAGRTAHQLHDDSTQSIERLRDLEAMVTDGRYDTLSKKEIARNEKGEAQAPQEPRGHPSDVAPA